MIPKKLQYQLESHLADITFRTGDASLLLVDFASNDYLGFSMSNEIFDRTHYYLENEFIFQNGSKGSWLLSGNHQLYPEIEQLLCSTHNSDAALIFNSGYNANLGFFSCVPQDDDLVLYDEWIHTSIKDGISMGNARGMAFKHNDLDDLRRVYEHQQTNFSKNTEVYVVTESVFSLDGDSPDLLALAKFCEDNRLRLVIDEAQAIGVLGNRGVGLVQHLGIAEATFARLISFGKALSSHGAAILGAQKLIDYLVYFSRPSSYTTAIPPNSLMLIKATYKELQLTHAIKKLLQNIALFKAQVETHQLDRYFFKSASAIQSCLIGDSKRVKVIVAHLNDNGFDAAPLFYPTVPRDQERIRFCIHAYNSEEEITEVVSLLAPFLK